jgi:hypothetical protein
MSYYEYGQDILQDVLFRNSEPTDLTGSGVSDYLDAAKRYVQRAYNDILDYAPWPWILKDPPGVLSVEAKKTNTATATQGSTSVTLGTVISSSVAGWWLEIDTEGVPYRIIAHTGGTADITLDATYKEDSVSAGACTIYKDEYDLASDCRRPWFAWDRNNPQRDIEIIQRGEMHQRFPQRSSSGIGALIMAVIRDKKVRITPWPETDDITVEYEYAVDTDTDLDWGGGATDTPLVPLRDRHVISDAATAFLMLDKNDPRAEEAAALVNPKLEMMFNTYINVGRRRRFIKRGSGIWH